MKIITIIGARPQFIKASVLSREFNKSKLISEIIVHTGQHFDDNMSQIFFNEMGIPKPKYLLNINKISHASMVGKMLIEIENVLNIEKPDFVLVYGDTNTTLAGALAAKKMKTKVIHVEAGLRSNNTDMPEEINRIVTDRISDILFCPTSIAMKNLKKEGYKNFPCRYYNSGDLMLDALRYFLPFSEKKNNLVNKNISDSDYILCTIHREENLINIKRLKGIINSLNQLSRNYKIIFPVHPRTKKILEVNKIKTKFTTILPVGYFEMLQLIKNSNLIITDSGGLQREAFFLNKYSLILRNETEWLEIANKGYSFLVGNDIFKIINTVNKYFGKVITTKSKIFGNGKAAQFIVRQLLNNY